MNATTGPYTYTSSKVNTTTPDGSPKVDTTTSDSSATTNMDRSPGTVLDGAIGDINVGGVGDSSVVSSRVQCEGRNGRNFQKRTHVGGCPSD